MAISYNLGIPPRWFFTDTYGKPLAGGKLFSFSQSNPNQPKLIYSDPNGDNPYPNPITFGLNGMINGNLYFQFDTSINDTYYLAVYDMNNNLQFVVQNYTGSSGGGGGGGGNVTYYQNLDNLIINNVFSRYNSSSTNTNPNGPYTIGTVPLPLGYTLIAPSAHNNFAFPDIQFYKDSTGANDQLSIVNFSPGINLTQDVTPPYYLNYETDANGRGETNKYIQVPINNSVSSLQSVPITITFWAQVTGSSVSFPLQANLVQYFGLDGSQSVITPVGSSSIITSTWTPFVVTVGIPSIGTNSIGSYGDDGLYIRFSIPPATSLNLNFIKPSFYVGNVPFPGFTFQSYDQINSVLDTPRTGTVKISLYPNEPGYVAANDGTIGNYTSGATTANVITWQLYNYIWHNVGYTFAPMFDMNGNPTGNYGPTAAADFKASRRLSLTKTLGRVMAGLGSPNFLGQTIGLNTTNLTVGQLANHTHGVVVGGDGNVRNIAGNGITGNSPVINTYSAHGTIAVGNPFWSTNPASVTIEPTGSGDSIDIRQPTVYMNFLFKL